VIGHYIEISSIKTPQLAFLFIIPVNNCTLNYLAFQSFAF